MVTDSEIGACYLQGILFHDDDLDWCRISGWGVENGIILIFYSPLSMTNDDPTQNEEYVSLMEFLHWIQFSPHPILVPKVDPSRILKRANRTISQLCYRQLSYKSNQMPVIEFGMAVPVQMEPKPESYNGKLLSDRIIKRILRAQETIFKYGTMIPRNDAEASRSPEAVRWLSGKQLEWLRLKQVLP
jgi:hypothetical protein